MLVVWRCGEADGSFEVVPSRDVSGNRFTDKLILRLGYVLQKATLRNELHACVLEAPHFGHFCVIGDHIVIGKALRNKVTIERCHFFGSSNSSTDRYGVHNLSGFLLVPFLLSGFIELLQVVSMNLRLAHGHLALIEPGEGSRNRLINELLHHVVQLVTEPVRLLARAPTDFACRATLVHSLAFALVAGARLGFLLVRDRLR